MPPKTSTVPSATARGGHRCQFLPLLWAEVRLSDACLECTRGWFIRRNNPRREDAARVAELGRSATT